MKNIIIGLKLSLFLLFFPQPVNAAVIINGYQLSVKEISIIKWLIYRDFVSYIENGKNNQEVLANLYPGKITAYELQNEYDKNEVKADVKYKGKQLIIFGIISSINRGIGDNYYLSLGNYERTSDGLLIFKQFQNPNNTIIANMNDGLINYLYNLQKGKDIILTCVGGGMILGSAILNECSPSEIWIKDEIDKNYFPLFISSVERNLSAFPLILFGISFSRILPESSCCHNFSGDLDKYYSCMSEYNNLWKIENKDRLTENLKLTLDKMHMPDKVTNRTIESFRKEFSALGNK